MVTTAHQNKTRYPLLLAAVTALLLLGLVGQMFWVQPALNQAAMRLNAGSMTQVLWQTPNVATPVKRAALVQFVTQLQSGSTSDAAASIDAVAALPKGVLAAELSRLLDTMQRGDDASINAALVAMVAGLTTQLEQKQVIRLIFWLAISVGVVGITAWLLLSLSLIHI